MSRAEIGDTVALNNGVRIPWLGLGTYETDAGVPTYHAVTAALETGYRHIDTAAFYGNEHEVGQAVRDSGLPREEIFVATKLWNADHGPVRAMQGFERSADRLDIGPLAPSPLHWLVPQLRRASWPVLEGLLAGGRARAIGVSNYTVRHLRELLAECDVVPAVNQVELSPFLYQRELIDFCHARGIRVEAYSPLTKAQRLDDPTLRRVASTQGRTPAQVLIRWCLQHELVVIPKSADARHIRENADVFDFELSPAELAALDALDEGFRTSWDPTGEA